MKMSIEFIGRGREIAFLRNWLDDADSPSIVYIHDEYMAMERKGGIGKTWLLRRFYELVEQEQENVIPVLVDFFNVLDRDSVVIAERVVQAIRTRYPAWTTENFDKLLKIYHGVARGQKSQMAILRERIADALNADLLQLDLQMVKTNTRLLLFFDTYELIEYDPSIAVLRPRQTFPDIYQSNRVRAIIAGRNTIDWTHNNWVGREKEVIILSLAPFNYNEAIQYLISCSDVYDLTNQPSQVLEALYRRTEGRPILLGLVTDVLNKEIVNPETLVEIDRALFEASLVGEINHLDNPIKWVILTMAHIHYRFNAAFLNQLINLPGLKELVPEMQYWELVKVLPTLSFVRSSGSGEDFVLHDEMRRLINKYSWPKLDPDARIRRELSKLAVNYYTELVDREENVEQRQSYIVEKLFHELFLDVEMGFQSFDQHFTYAIDFSLLDFARALLIEVQKFEPQLSPARLKDIRLAEAKILHKEGHVVVAQEIFQQLQEPIQTKSIEEDLVQVQKQKEEQELFQESIGLANLQRIEEDLVQVQKQEDITKSDIYIHGSVRGLVYGEHNTVTISFHESKEQTVPFLAPPQPFHGLVGRENLLRDLKQKLFRRGSFALCALNGLPGVGKTALALILAYDQEVLDQFYDGVLWAGLGREAKVSSHLASWGIALGISQFEIGKLASTRELMQIIHQAIGTRHMLLVIDDAWSPEQALAFKLGGPNCAHIVTTRLPEVAERFAGEGTIIVRELQEDESLRLLEQQAPSISTKAPDEVRDIIHAVDGLPLPLFLMGNYLRIQMKTEQPRRLRSALDRLVQVKERLQLEQPLGGLENHPSLPEGTPISQLAVIKISDEALDKEAQQALRALSVFPPKPNSFSEEAALAVAATSTKVIDRLLDFGLLESSGPTRYTLHQTISEYAQVNLTDTTVYERMATFFNEYVRNHLTDRNLLERETRNILAAVGLLFERGMTLSDASAFAHFIRSVLMNGAI